MIDLARMTHYERALRFARPFMADARKEVLAILAADGAYGKNARAKLIEFLQTAESASMQQISSRMASISHRIFAFSHAATVEVMRKRASYKFIDLATDDEFTTLMNVVVGNYHGTVSANEAINVAGQMHYQMAAHELAGRRVYEVSSGLAQKLSNTELRGLRTDDLRLPYESIYVLVPSNAGLRVHNIESDWHVCNGVYITEDVDTDGCRLWRFMSLGEPKPINLQQIDPNAPRMELDNDAIVFWKVRLPSGDMLDDAIAATSQQMNRDMTRYSSSFKKMTDEWRRIFEFTMNSVIYATWQYAERDNVIADREARQLWERVQKMPNSRKRSNVQSRLSKMELYKRTVLGRSVTIDRSASHEDTGATRLGMPLTVLTRVAGHWKHVTHGPQHSLRRLQWIEPYFRGPDDGPLSIPRHVLKTTEAAP